MIWREWVVTDDSEEGQNGVRGSRVDKAGSTPIKEGVAEMRHVRKYHAIISQIGKRVCIIFGYMTFFG